MAQLFLAEVHNNTGKSTETIYEIKAPLATFDTIDLDDDSLSLRSQKSDIVADTPEKGIKETAESGSQGSSFDFSDDRSTPVCGNEGVTNVVGPSEAVAEIIVESCESAVSKDTDSSNTTIHSDAEGATGGNTQTNGDMIEPNSSENNASAEEIQTKLKVKGRKHKEKSSNVKYEKIDNSDMSDQERSSPMPALKFQMNPSKLYSTDSDSSDSDNGYIRGGFIATTRGSTSTRQIKPGPHHFTSSRFGVDTVDSDSTPCNSPKTVRPILPPPLSKEDAEKMSKKKAYEKRLQRLQVTTNPVERPRSTTPINIFSLDEYVSLSSPEKSPTCGSQEKLKITLPMEEGYRSPRRSSRGSALKSADGNEVFNFSEDLLFTHTKSAFLVEDGQSRGVSPKRILVPPTLSPKLSPARSPVHSRSGSCSPRYYYSPGSRRQGHSRESSLEIKSEFLSRGNDENWANFDKVNTNTTEQTVAFKDITDTTVTTADGLKDQETDKHAFKTDNKPADDDMQEENKNGFVDNFSEFLQINGKEKALDTEEVLTIKIADDGYVNSCDIKCDVVEHSSVGNQVDSSVKQNQADEKCIESRDQNTTMETDKPNVDASDNRNNNHTLNLEDEFDSLC